MSKHGHLSRDRVVIPIGEVPNIDARSRRGQHELCDLSIGIDIPSRGGWPNLAGVRVSVGRGDELPISQETDAFGQVVVEFLPVADLPDLTIAIATSEGVVLAS